MAVATIGRVVLTAYESVDTEGYPVGCEGYLAEAGVGR